jgi:hypothetical protein
VLPQPVQKFQNSRRYSSHWVHFNRCLKMLRKLKREQDRALIIPLLYHQVTRHFLPCLASSSTQHCCSWGIYLGLDPGCVTGRTGFCTPRTAPNAVQSAGASRMERDGKPSTVLHRCALRPCRPCDGDGEEAPGGNGGSNHRQGLQIGGCQPHTSPGPWTRYPVAPRMCWCPTCRKDEKMKA